MPQEAGPGEVILSKRNELGLLSNFAATPFEFHGQRYASLEGFWQMMKYPEGPDDPREKFPGIKWNFKREAVAQMTASTPSGPATSARRNMEKMGIDWVTFEGKQMPYKPKEPGEHYRLIEEATRAKVEQNPEVKRVLLATGRPNSETRSSPGKRCTGGVALLRYSHEDSRRTAERIWAIAGRNVIPFERTP